MEKPTRPSAQEAGVVFASVTLGALMGGAWAVGRVVERCSNMMKMGRQDLGNVPGDDLGYGYPHSVCEEGRL